MLRWHISTNSSSRRRTFGFEAALRAFARVSGIMVARGYEAPVLVGGGAVELFSTSALATGDFDIVTGAQSAFEESLRGEGFIKPSGAGIATRGWVHPDLALGFEVVSAVLLGGLADRDRVLAIDVGDDGSAAILSVEDMIADRMGQFASGSAPEMIDQARVMLALNSQVDRDYLNRRIAEETMGDLSIDDLEGHSP